MYGVGVLDTRVLTGDNPFGVAADHYTKCQTPDYDDVMWSETHYWSAWSPVDTAGVYVHMGTTPEDPDLWWAQVFAFLPDGHVLVDRCWGRSPDRHGPCAGNFRAISPSLGHWILSYDGAGELCRSEDLTTGIRGAGPALPFRFEVALAPAMPVWDLFKATSIGEREWSGCHHEQVHSCKGWLEVAGRQGGRYNLDDGGGFRDHSHGHRDFSRLGGDHLGGWYFPESRRAVQLLHMWTFDGKVEISAASIWEGGQLELIEPVFVTGIDHEPPRSLTHLRGDPRRLEMVMDRPSGATVTALLEVQHLLIMSNTSPNTNLNGAALGADGLLLCETPMTMTWPDGEVGYGHLERGYREHLLPQGTL